MFYERYRQYTQVLCTISVFQEKKLSASMFNKILKLCMKYLWQTECLPSKDAHEPLEPVICYITWQKRLCRCNKIQSLI